MIMRQIGKTPPTKCNALFLMNPIEAAHEKRTKLSIDNFLFYITVP
jgi:hypothetical protein